MRSANFYSTLIMDFSEQNPTRFYRWRRKETGEDIIQLDEDDELYFMTFSHGGNKVVGDWGTINGDTRAVKSTGRENFVRMERLSHLNLEYSPLKFNTPRS